MKFKEFLKSTAFRSVVVLVAITLVCILALSVLSDVLYVSQDERDARQYAKLYPGADSYTKLPIDYNFATNPNYGEVLGVTEAVKGGSRVAVVIEAKSAYIPGEVGYAGNVTCYVVIDAVTAEIVSWSVGSFTGETLMANFGNKQYTEWYVGHNVSLPVDWSTVYLAGVTRSSRAINAAVNMAAEYSRNALSIGRNPESEAKEALGEQLAATNLADLEWTSTPAANFKFLSTDANPLAFVFASTFEDRDILALTYGEGEELFFVVFDPLLIDESILYNTEGTPEEVIELATSVQFIASVPGTRLSYAVNAESVTYTVAAGGVGMGPANTFTIIVTDGVLTAITAEGDLTTEEYIGNVHLWKLEDYVGKTVSEIVAPTGDGSGTFPTNSNTVIYNALMVALRHYNANFMA
jgi:hypothetical protein